MHSKLSEGFSNSCFKIVSSILLQEIFNNFAICKHCMKHIYFNEDVTSSNYIFQKGATHLMDEPRTCHTLCYVA